MRLHGIRNVVAVVCCVVQLSAIAFGQTGSRHQSPDERLPQQILARDIEQYSQWLGLSRAQSHALGLAYLKYLEQYRELEPRIAEYFNRPPLKSPSMDDVIAWLREDIRLNEDIRARLRMMDEELFASIQLMLADEQIPTMQRVRDHRRRQVAQLARFMQLTGRPTIDLTKLISTFAFDPAVEQTVADIQRSYEQSLTPLYVKLDPPARSWFLDLQLALRDRGLGTDATREQFVPVAAQVVAPALILAAQIDSLNDATFQRILQVLDEPQRQQWRAHTVVALYPELAGFVQLINRTKRGLDQPQFQTEEAASIASPLLAEMNRRGDQWLSRLMTSSDLQHARHSPYEFDNELRRQFESLLQEAAADLRTAAEELQAALEAARGMDAAAAFRAEFDRDRDTFGNTSVVSTEAPPSLRVESIAISRAQIDRWCALLGFPADDRIQLDEAFARYQRGIEDLTAAESQSKVKWLAAESAVKAVHKLDAHLFESIHEISAQSEVAAIATAIQSTRARQLLWHGIIRAQWAANGDVGAIVLEASIPADELLRALPRLEEYNDQLLPVLTEWARTSRQYEQIDDGWDYESQVLPVYESMRRAPSSVARINRETLDSLDTLLGPEAARTVRSSFNRQCFPELFVDPGSSRPVFQAIHSLESMPSDRILTLDELEAAYRSRYEEITQKIIDAIGDTAFSRTDQLGRREPACRDCIRDFNYWKAEREELNALTKLRLSALLTAQQAERLDDLLRIAPSMHP